MTPEKLTRQYLSEKHMMQLATVAGDQPWCCTVYFVSDGVMNVYWASLTTRRHSNEIAHHSHVAAAIPVQHVIGKPVIGIQIEGDAKIIEAPEEIRPIAQKYAKKFNRSEQWVNDFSNLATDHRLYKLSPHLMVLFDEQHFASSPRHELRLA